MTKIRGPRAEDRRNSEDRNPKSECRNLRGPRASWGISSAEKTRKFEPLRFSRLCVKIRLQKTLAPALRLKQHRGFLRISDFGLPSDFGIRISDFRRHVGLRLRARLNLRRGLVLGRFH